jgi:nicotinamide mononucleotide (NMN) deamidase PncC
MKNDTVKIDQKDISKIHESAYKLVIVSSGGGTNAISSLLEVPGASNTVLESYIPYAKESLDAYLNKTPDHYCSLNTSLSMAARAFQKAKKIMPNTNPKYLLGISVTASLVTTYKKLGEHKFFITLQTESYSKTISCELKKGKRSRNQEENLVSAYIFMLINEACGLNFNKPEHTEIPEIKTVEASTSWIKLINNRINYVSSHNDKPELIFPGSFNPLHQGHIEMRELAEKRTGMRVTFEICIENAEKPPLTFHEMKRTLDQFSDNDSWVMTRHGRFSEKAKLFPNSVFIIGADTLVRIMDEKFYLNRKDMLGHIERFNDHNINFLVFGRKVKDSFITLDQIDIPNSIKSRFTGVDETGFRQDISSKSLRLEKI